MTRAGSIGDSHRRPLSWVIVAASLPAYLGLVGALGIFGIHLDMPVPWWVSQAAPPLVYALLVFVVARPRSVMSLGGGALLLWAVHLFLGMFTEPILALVNSAGGAGATWSFPPAPLPELLWVPVLLLPLRDLLRGAPVRRSVNPQPAAGRRPAPDRTTPAPASATPVEKAMGASVTAKRPLFDKPVAPQTRPLGATTVTSMVASVEPRPESSGPPVAVPVAAASGLTAPPAAPEPKERTPARAERLTEELLARETSDEPLPVTAIRVLTQLPAEALAVPADRLAEELGAQLFLLIPRRLALAQLGGGVVRAGWDVLSPQVPSRLLAMSHEAIKAGLPDGSCVLPLDEIVRQFSPETFAPVGPEPDLRGIEAFPVPFQPRDIIRSEAAPAPEIEGRPSAVGSAPIGPDILAVVPATAVPVNSVSAQRRPERAAVEPPVQAIPPDSPMPAPVQPEQERPEPAPARPGIAPQDNLQLLRGLTALLPAVSPLAVEVRMVAGVTLLSAMSPGVGDEVAPTAAAFFLPLMGSGRWPWTVDQLTLRGPRVALILTPLAGGPVLAACVPPGGGLALLELRCRQAAAVHAGPAGAPLHTAASDGENDEPDLLDVEPSTRIREVASSLSALGTVTASSRRDPETDRVLYLFLPAGSDVRAVGAIAHDVSDAMRQAAAAGVTFRTAIVRSAARRMVIRLPAGRSDTIVAAGETARPGLAYLQVEHAAASLGAL